MQSLEPYNKLATNIKYNNLENPYKAILITSTVMDELKSTICCNLAYSLAINKKKVCVVDLDLRKPVMHKAFKISKENGIVEYVDGSITKEELIKHTESGVDVITAGKNAFNTLVILEHSKLKTLIEELKKEYDYVLLDTTPVVATDCLVAAKLADGIIYNIAINTAKKKNIQESIKTVKTIGNTIIGIVVTKAYLDSNDKYYYNYYKSND
ncbi:MAG: CpsD/CapB family tyrosine-protein kinase [Anaeroplasma sp.]